MPDVSTILYIALCFFLGGLLKGVAGLGLPLIALPMLSFALPLKTTVALLIVPVFATNVAQSFQGGLAKTTLRRFWISWLMVLVVIAVAAQALVAVNERILYAIIGITLVLMTITLRYRPSLQIKPAQEVWTSPAAAAISGVFGGFTGLYGPPFMIYLASLRLKKTEFVTTISQFFVAGSIGITLGLLNFGGAGGHDLALSAGATLPAALGLWVGQRVHARLNESHYSALLYVLYLASGASFLIRAF